MLLVDEIVWFFSFLGSLVCHQKPDRTLWIGGEYLPVCARDTGVFVGLLSSYMLLLIMRRREAKGPPNLYLSSAMTLPLWVDSFGQLLGLWTSTNDLRLITGLLFGIAVTPLLIYVLSLYPLGGRIPLIRTLQPVTTVLDDKDSWFDKKALLVGIVLSVALFFTIRSLVGLELTLFYWILAIPIVVGIIWHFFIIPSLLILATLRGVYHNRRS